MYPSWQLGAGVPLTPVQAVQAVLYFCMHERTLTRRPAGPATSSPAQRHAPAALPQPQGAAVFSEEDFQKI